MYEVCNNNPKKKYGNQNFSLSCTNEDTWKSYEGIEKIHMYKIFFQGLPRPAVLQETQTVCEIGLDCLETPYTDNE